MGRPTYPSDHRRYFHVLEDILDSPKLRDEVSADVFRFYIRLLAMLNRTKSRDGSINLGRRALNLCAGREQRRHSLAIARGGAVAGLYTLSVDGEQALIRVPNWAKHQGYTPTTLRPDSDETPPPNPVPNPTPTTPPISPPKSDKPGSPEAKAREAWPELRRAAAAYGVGWGKTPGSAQVKIIADRIKADGLNEDQLEAIIHGYIALRGTTPDDRFDPLKHLYPSTLYRPKNWPNYLAAAESAPKRKEPKRTIFEGYDRSGHKLPTEPEIAAALEKGRELFKH